MFSGLEMSVKLQLTDSCKPGWSLLKYFNIHLSFILQCHCIFYIFIWEISRILAWNEGRKYRERINLSHVAVRLLKKSIGFAEVCLSNLSQEITATHCLKSTTDNDPCIVELISCAAPSTLHGRKIKQISCSCTNTLHSHLHGHGPQWDQHFKYVRPDGPSDPSIIIPTISTFAIINEKEKVSADG